MKISGCQPGSDKLIELNVIFLKKTSAQLSLSLSCSDERSIVRPTMIYSFARKTKITEREEQNQLN